MELIIVLEAFDQMYTLIFIFIFKYHFIKDLNRISSFVKEKWNQELENKELALKGWNYGETEFEGCVYFKT
jgi:nuclear transport factor 2 (NTF2) superfamily protein